MDISIVSHQGIQPQKIAYPPINSSFVKIEPPAIQKSGKYFGFQVFMSETAYKAMWKHANSDLDNEVGGAIIGYFCEDIENEKIKFLIVTDILNMPSEYFKSPAFLKFTSQFLNDLDDYVEEIRIQNPNLIRLGLYHSHPGYSVFLSGTDIRTFKGIFKDEWQIALVVDPVNIDEGVFFWHKGKISKKNGFDIYTESDDIDYKIHKAATGINLLANANKHCLEFVENS